LQGFCKRLLRFTLSQQTEALWHAGCLHANIMQMKYTVSLLQNPWGLHSGHGVPPRFRRRDVASTIFRIRSSGVLQAPPVIRTYGVLAACVFLFVSAGWAEEAAVAEHSAPLHSSNLTFNADIRGAEGATAAKTSAPGDKEPAWMARSVAESRPGRADQDYRKATWRSMGVLALLVGVLVGVQHLIRKRLPTYARPTAALRIVGRLRLGARQEVVLVEWEGEQLALGVGASFIHCLHVRPIGTAETERKSGI